MTEQVIFTDGVFQLGKDEIIEKDELPNKEILPIIGNHKQWDQYTNEFIYKFDALVREFIEIMNHNGYWKSHYMARRYTYSMIIERLYGRPYNPKTDQKNLNAACRILAYYSSRIQKGGMINGKNYSKTVYTLSPHRLRKPPYSLRLRLEWLQDQGILPNSSNMRLPKDNLKPGERRSDVGRASNRKDKERV